MKNKHITGHLKLSASAMRDTSYDRDDVHAAIEAHQLGHIMYLDNQWYRGVIRISALYRADEGADIESMVTSDVTAISEALSEFLKADTIAKLDLRGEIIINVEDTEAGATSMAKLTVKEGQLSYQRTRYIWSESVTV